MSGAHGCAVRALFEGAPGRVLVVAAHPDDETIGFGATLGALVRDGWRANVLHVTNGVPRDLALRPTLCDRTPEEAAAIRLDEAKVALRAQGLDDRALLLPCLDIVDQEAALAMPHIATTLTRIIEERGIDVVVTHPFEGGHPDHDAVAFASHAAVARERSRVALAEMTSYHAETTSCHRAASALVTGAFLPHGRSTPCARAMTRRLGVEESARKRRMMDAFASQAHVLAPFGAGEERIRCAPEYDFTRPPHDGELHYETLPFGWTGARFCELARRAATELAED